MDSEIIKLTCYRSHINNSIESLTSGKKYQIHYSEGGFIYIIENKGNRIILAKNKDRIPNWVHHYFLPYIEDTRFVMFEKSNYKHIKL